MAWNLTTEKQERAIVMLQFGTKHGHVTANFGCTQATRKRLLTKVKQIGHC